LPDRTPHATLDDVLACDSARLFMDRARLSNSSFNVSAGDDCSKLVSICHRLDGIPLAIELAAPRLRSMSITELHRRLDDLFSVLTSGSRTNLPRQRTLRSLIDWSYDLLTSDERRVLQRLSVFAGGWTAEAAEQVCAGEGIRAEDVLELLTSLIDKSLVTTGEQRSTTRYRLLETVRHYAGDRLAESGHAQATSRRHFA
jgi:non-specific serine/threonine protein kinase